jgi:hypothetical protein
MNTKLTLLKYSLLAIRFGQIQRKGYKLLERGITPRNY